MLVSLGVLLVAAVVVGFVTSALRIWIDRVFFVIILLTLGHLPIREAIALNLMVLLFASLSHGLVRREGWLWGAFARFPSWEGWAAILSGLAGGALGHEYGLALSPKFLLLLLGLYAIAMALRLVFVKPVEGRPTPEHPGWIVPVAFGAGALTGLVSAGGKPLAIPLYNWALGHRLPVAYAIATFGTIGAALGAVLAHQALKGYSGAEVMTAIYAWAGISIVAWLTDRVWSPKLMKVTALLVALVLFLVGLKFVVAAF